MELGVGGASHDSNTHCDKTAGSAAVHRSDGGGCCEIGPESPRTAKRGGGIKPE